MALQNQKDQNQTHNYPQLKVEKKGLPQDSLA